MKRYAALAPRHKRGRAREGGMEGNGVYSKRKSKGQVRAMDEGTERGRNEQK